MQVWSHNLQTVVAPMAFSRLGSCPQWHIIELWQTLKKLAALKQCVFFDQMDFSSAQKRPKMLPPDTFVF